MDFKFIRKFMIEKGMSYQKFADSVGYSRIHIHDVINGRQKPSNELKLILIDRMIMELEKQAEEIQERLDRYKK